MKFIDCKHQSFYSRMIDKTNSQKDRYRKAMFYTLGLMEDTRRHINNIYDFQENVINIESLNSGWQGSGSLQVTRLAFNLYNGFSGSIGGEEIDEPEMYSPYHLFETDLMEYFFEAVRLRYPNGNR